MDNGRPGIPGHRGPFPAGPGRGAALTGAPQCPVPGAPEPGRSRPLAARPGSTRARTPLPPHPPPRAGKTRNLGSGAEATDRVTARVGGSGRNSVRPPRAAQTRRSPGRAAGWPGSQPDDPGCGCGAGAVPGPAPPRPPAAARDPAVRPHPPAAAAPLPRTPASHSRRAPGRTSVLVIRCRPSFTTAKLPLPSVPSMS